MSKGETCRKNRILLPLLLVLAFAVTASAVGIVSARYIQSREETTGVLTSKTMYFESDYLTEAGKSYTISATEVSFTLMNYPDTLRFSELDVNYTVTVDNGATLSQSSGTLSAGAQDDITITVSNLERGKTYTVTAVGENGYKKTLKASFTVTEEENRVYKSVEQTEHYVVLTVWSERVTGTCTVTFPNGLLPDNTDPILAGVTTGQGSFTDSASFVGEYASRSYRFFIAGGDTTNYTEASFGVTVGTTAAE